MPIQKRKFSTRVTTQLTALAGIAAGLLAPQRGWAEGSAADMPTEMESLSEQDEADLLRLEQLNDLIQRKEAKIVEIQADLDREYDRNGKLRRKLLTEYRQGCRSQESVANLEVFLKGTHLADSDWDRAFTEEERSTEGNPERISIGLSKEINLVNSNEVENPIFTQDGYIASEDFGAFKVADLQYLRVKKGGKGQKADLNCWSIFGWTKWGPGKKCEWQNRESHRYALDEVTVKVNGEVFLRFTGLDFQFADNQDTWQETQLSKSTEYIQFMTSDSCK